MTQPHDPYDELASMFLTEAVTGTATGTASSTLTPPEPATVEVLMVGHLPVRGALWLTPYADSIARRAGTTALVRLDADEPMLQVLGTPREPDAIADALASRNLREAILRLGPAVRSWVVRPSSRIESRALLSTVDRIPPDRITILSSVDQAAAANVYTLIKSLVETARHLDCRMPAIALAMVGREPERARQIARKIDGTARKFLDVPVPLVNSLWRIDEAMKASELRSFPGQGRPELDAVLGWIAEARTTRRSERPTRATSTPKPLLTPVTTPDANPVMTPDSPTPAAKPVSPAITTGADALPAGVDVPSLPLAVEIAGGGHEDARSGDVFAPPAPDTSSPDPAWRSDVGIKLPPKAATAHEPKTPAPPHEPHESGRPIPLARHVTDATRSRGATPSHLTPIAPRCPGYERVEFAVDAAGNLHLLGREDMLRAMPVVATWAKTHRELITMACSDSRIDPRGRVVCHVFTETPARVADLHASALHLHVLAPVDVAGKRGWYVAALNTPGRLTAGPPAEPVPSFRIESR